MKIELMFVIITGLLIIGILEVVAMAIGMNGVCLSTSVGAIAAIITGTFTFLITKAKIKKG